MMATDSNLSPRDNVAAIKALEHATMRIARERRFLGVFTTNTSPLTQVVTYCQRVQLYISIYTIIFIYILVNIY